MPSKIRGGTADKHLADMHIPRVSALGAGGGAAAPLLLDSLSNVAAAYSFRKLRTAYAGSAVRIRESGGNTELDIGFSGNNFDTAAAAAHIGANSGFIVTWYDQSGGSKDASHATAANQPLYVASGINTKPIARFDGTADNLLIGGSLSLASGSKSLYAVCTGHGAADQRFLLDAQTGRLIFALATATVTKIGWFDGAYKSIADSTSASQILEWVLTSGGNGEIFRNAVSLGTAAYAAKAIGGAVRIGGEYTGTGANFMASDLGELVLFDAAITAGTRATLDASASSYYGISI